MNNFLEVKNVSKQYANHKALDNVSLSVKKGSVFGLLGPNGAGKTSLIRIINRITAADEGDVILDGEHISKYDISKIGYLPEERGLYRKMKVGEHAIYLARLKGLSKSDATARLKEWFEKFDIMPWWNKKIEELSKGMQQKIQFVCTVIHEPELLIFDEPFSGFDPVNAELLKREILELRDKGRTIIFSTHNMQSVEEICEDIALINSSKVVLSGSVQDIRKQNAKDSYSISLFRNGKDLDLSNYELLDTFSLGDLSRVKIRKNEGQNMIDIMQDISSKYKIISIEEELPSMHEIFINTIKSNEK